MVTREMRGAVRCDEARRVLSDEAVGRWRG